MGITRAYFRISDMASAQHETALVQAVSKLLALGKTSEDKIMLFRSSVVPLGTLLITGVYDDGIFQCSVVTRVSDNDSPDTMTLQTLAGCLPKSLVA